MGPKSILVWEGEDEMRERREVVVEVERSPRREERDEWGKRGGRENESSGWMMAQG